MRKEYVLVNVEFNVKNKVCIGNTLARCLCCFRRVLEMGVKLQFLIGLFSFRCAICWNTENSHKITADDNLIFAHLVSQTDFDLIQFSNISHYFSPSLKIMKLCRHGEKYPMDTYPNDECPLVKYWPGFGELTDVSY